MIVRQGASARLVCSTDAEPTAASAPGHGTEQLFTVLDALARAEATERRSLSERVFDLIGSPPAGTTLVVLTADVDEGLPEALAAYTSAGIQVLVIYADPRSFQREMRHPLRETQYDWYHALTAVRAQVVLLHRDAERRLRPEVVDAGRYSEQSVV
jgi:uncharacterized protein (DUF58 family)